MSKLKADADSQADLATRRAAKRIASLSRAMREAMTACHDAADLLDEAAALHQGSDRRMRRHAARMCRLDGAALDGLRSDLGALVVQGGDDEGDEE